MDPDPDSDPDPQHWFQLYIFSKFWSSKPWIQIHMKCWIGIRTRIRIQCVRILSTGLKKHFSQMHTYTVGVGPTGGSYIRSRYFLKRLIIMKFFY